MRKYKLPVVQAADNRTIDQLLDLEVATTSSFLLSEALKEEKSGFVYKPFTGPEITKDYISYSELATWMECAFRHKLKYIDKVGTDGPSEHTEYGQVIHDALEFYLEKREMPNVATVRQTLAERFSQLTTKAPLKESEWHDTIEPILSAVPEFLDKEFPGWTYVYSEHEMLEPIQGHTRKFKGFIDGVIKAPKKRQPKDAAEPVMEYHIIDWKSTGWGWSLDKKLDPKKTMQLVLYKHFFARKFNIELKDIKCHFVLLKRTNKKERCELVTVSVGEKAVEKALTTVDQMLGYLKKGFFPKNRESCKYCMYKNTEHCP